MKDINEIKSIIYKPMAVRTGLVYAAGIALAISLALNAGFATSNSALKDKNAELQSTLEQTSKDRTVEAARLTEITKATEELQADNASMKSAMADNNDKLASFSKQLEVCDQLREKLNVRPKGY